MFLQPPLFLPNQFLQLSLTPLPLLRVSRLFLQLFDSRGRSRYMPFIIRKKDIAEKLEEIYGVKLLSLIHI